MEKPQVTILCCVRKDRGRGGNRWLESRTNSVPANEARLEIGICVFWVTETMLQPTTNYNCPKHFPSTTTLQSTSCLIPVKRLLSVKAAWRVNPMSKVWKVHLWQEIYQISILLNWPLADYISPDTLTLSPGTFINLPSDQRAWHVVMCPGNPYFKLQVPSWQKARWKYLLWKLCRHWAQWPSNQWSPAPWPRPADWAPRHRAYYPIKCFLALLWNR